MLVIIKRKPRKTKKISEKSEQIENTPGKKILHEKR
jgi:hypothetical protein